MTKSELYSSTTSGEDSFTEFKRDVSQRSDFASEMIAFANVEGGRILVGVDDSGTIVGVQEPKHVEEAILNIARHNCVPPLSPTIEHVQDDEGNSVVVVEVPRRLEVPHENNSGQCYLRVGSTKRLCTPQERARLLQSASLVHFDEIPIGKTSSADLELEAFGEYYQRIYEQPLAQADIPLTPMLENMRFLVTDLRGEQCLSLAGLLLFGKRPQDFLPHGYISAVRWEGVEASETIIDRQDIRGRLGPVKIEFPDLPYLVIEQGPAQDGDEWYSSTGDRPRDASSSASSSRRQRPFCRSRRGPQANGLRPAGPFGWLSRGSIPTSSRRSARAGRPN